MTQLEKMAFLNACDCLRYGYGRTYWNSCGLEGADADRIWKKAMDHMSTF